MCFSYMCIYRVNQGTSLHSFNFIKNSPSGKGGVVFFVSRVVVGGRGGGGGGGIIL